MAIKLQYLTDPLLGFQTKNGSLNTAGIINVYDAATDDPAVTYKDFVGTRNAQDIRLDDDGRAVIIADDSRAYRVEVRDQFGALLYTQSPMYAKGGGGGAIGGIDIISSDETVKVEATSEGGVKTFDLSVDKDDPEYVVCDSYYVMGSGNVGSGYIVPQNMSDGNMTVDSQGILLIGGHHYHIDAWLTVTADPDSANPTNEYRQREMTLNFRFAADGTTVDMVFDNSFLHSDSFTLSGDLHPTSDTYLKIYFDNYEWADYSSGSMPSSHISMPRIDVHSIVGSYNGGGDTPQYRPGTGIDITDDVISIDPTETQEKLTAGDGIIIDNNNEISVDTTAIQEKLEAGDNIVIEGNVISATAAPQEQSDWTETDTTDVSYIKHKPSTKPVVAGENITITEETNSFVISANTDSQVQADWSETDTEDPSYIQNKPDLSVYATTQAMDTALAGKQDVISDLAAIRNGAALGATATQPADLAAGLATKQDVISDLATIRSGAALGATSIQPSDLATVATTGSYDDLIDKPVIPAAQVQADWSESDSTSVSYIQHKPDLSVYATESELTAGLATKQDTISDLSDIRSGAALGETAIQPSDLATVATTGSYDDLTDKPVIPAAQVQSDWSETDTSDPSYIQNKPDLSVYATDSELTAGLATKQDTISDLANIRSGAAAGETAIQPGDLATVATTGDYDDLSDKPDLSVYATGAELTAGLATKQDTISDLATIRSGAALGATAIQPSDLATVATTGDYTDLSNTPHIPVIGTVTL